MLDRDLMVAALPGYELGEELGRGAWGIVVAARHRTLDRPVAIKQLPRAFAVDEAARTRFVAEARLIAQLDHPHIVKVFDYIASEGMRLIVMEYLPGGSLWDRFTTSGLDSYQACAVTLCMCAGLHSAHRQGIVHRDMKPENVLLADDGTPRLSDFGIAKVGHGSTDLTLAGTILGTPTYMAPEQAIGGELGPQCDIYALGTMLYELLSGRAPFDDVDTPAALLYAHVHTPPPELADVASTVPTAVADVVMRALAKNPQDRYSSAEEFGVELSRAATRSFGQDWLPHSGIPLREGGPIADAALNSTLATTPFATVNVSQVREHDRLDADIREAAGDQYQLGVDLGTTNTAAAVLRHGTAYVLHLGNRTATTPSAVFIANDGSMRVGDAAARRLIVDPESVATDFKRRIGDPTAIGVGSTSHTPIELTTALLGWVIERAREREDVDPDHVTICHPANWTEFKKDLLIEAVHRVTDAPSSLITEPQAAAVYYASQERVAPGTVVVVYDLGGGTFDSAVMHKTETEFEFLGEPEGIERLGGIDFDKALFHHVAQRLDGAPFQLDPTNATNATALAFLRRECVDAKEALSSDGEARISVMLPNVHRDIVVSRDEFENLIRPTLLDSLSALRRSMASADVESSDVHAVLLVGGSSRIPLVRELVSESVTASIALDVHPKHSVALGAALAERGAGTTRPARLGSPSLDRPITTRSEAQAAETEPFSMSGAKPAHTVAPTSPPAPQQPKDTVAPTSPPAPPSDTGESSAGINRWRWVTAVVVLLTGAVVGWLFLNSNSSPATLLRVTITAGTVEDGRVRVTYVTENFEPMIDATNPDAYHLHFFWNIYEPDSVGTQVPPGDRNPFTVWDRNSAGELVFDAFSVEDVPPGATAICAVVATNTHAVYQPKLATVTGNCISL